MWKRQATWNFLLLVGLLDLTLTGSCPTGWFGTGCSYMCHCSNNATCDLTTGECPPTVYCATGFFGPGCQYADIVTEMGSSQNPEFLVDGDKSTCNPDPTATSLTVGLNHSSNISWFRIHTDIDMSNRGMFVKIDNKLCEVLRMYRVSEKILDVTCDSALLVTQLLIKGPVVRHMCDLEISGGRNVALKQMTSQSSDYSDNRNGKAESSNAVDGNRNNDFDQGCSCSQTGNMDHNPAMYVILKRPEKIFRIVIYNRNVLQFRLNGFILEVYTSTYQRPVLNQTSRDNDSAIYFINLPFFVPPVSRVIIRKKHDPDLTNNYLTVCELELYKEHVCGNSLFGLYCDKSCSCEADQQCHPSTGACGTPCVKGKTGLQCSYPCHPNCLDNQCRDGECVSCKDGFEGAYCEKEFCAAGKYGIDCTLNCSKNCLDSKCNKTSGHCEACVGKQLLPLCDKEPVDDAPHKKDDEKDEKKIDDEFSFYNTYYLYLLLLLLLLIPLCLICLCCFKRERKKPVEEEKAPALAPKPKPKEQGPTAQEMKNTEDKESSVDNGE